MLLDFLCELYYDARIHEHHSLSNSSETKLTNFNNTYCIQDPKDRSAFAALYQVTRSPED